MMQLTPTMQKFILHWGEMGSTWGINRATAQIGALLYLSEDSLTAEEISETLSIARSTVSSGLHELQNWGLVRVAHVMGDRRDHFETLKDAAELFRVILKGRKSREIDPLLETLRHSKAEQGEASPYVDEQLNSMLEFLELFARLFEKSEEVSTEDVLKTARMLERTSVDTLLSLASLGERFGGSFGRGML